MCKWLRGEDVSAGGRLDLLAIKRALLCRYRPIHRVREVWIEALVRTKLRRHRRSAATIAVEL
ncbi:hypothetical protein BRM22_04295 [Xanthomonas oryzae pv. oryzae]|uniref:Uncharacterized protein n=1 Tax=Xanthomonas oryzae pv. oryzae TaxID=64187 RepID=A0A854CK77_XANOO|nr:hypothetical protein [Xanthomonas oryzae]ALZ73445.1 hypothetical protein APZ20_20150 [Xanthomonas oryzae pv. oryzae]AOS01196.1 hypothetical protein ATY42_03080 [Xanthomonas oryzae pv. oryzae]AOS08071.1 hypothetical protein ATY43_21035 [Xanthomonas oryzae pv. oryzae]AOS12254.1 hypothetical protein ATY44_20315 [Xanthomonas oryzae pv. oryzae]AOS16432.1 hypothetical protein ATY45_19985 [Xanthomonas oryzae pv. oryzae]